MSRNQKVNELEAIKNQAHAAYEAKKAELISQGLKSKERYELLKPLKAIEDEANRNYVAAANKEAIKVFNEINAECVAEQRAKKEAKRAARFA